MASSSGLPSYTNYLTSRCGKSISRVGAADGELLAVGRMKDEAVAPADPQIEIVDPKTLTLTIIRRGLLIVLAGLLLNAFPFFWWGKMAGIPDPTSLQRVLWRATEA